MSTENVWRGIARSTVFLAAIVCTGCGGRHGSSDAAVALLDAPSQSSDAGARDAGSTTFDARREDAASDSSDAALHDASAVDAQSGPIDASADAGPCPSGWATEVVDDMSSLGVHVTLRVSASGVQHLLYDNVESFATALMHATRAATDPWAIETVDPVEDPPSSLAIDSAGGLHVAYGAGSSMHYRYLAPGGAWSASERLTEDVAFFNTLVLDDSDEPHVCVANIYEVMEVARRADGTWQEHVSSMPTALSATWAVTGMDVASDRRGRIGLAFGIHDITAASPSEVLFAQLATDGTWSFETVDDMWAGSYGAALAYDHGGAAHVVYSEAAGTPATTALKFASRDSSGAWTSENVVAGGGESIALAMDAAGRAFLAYYDGHVKLATRSAAGTWSIDTIDDPGALGGSPYDRDVSLALDPAGSPVVAYIAAVMPARHRVLKIAHRCE